MNMISPWPWTWEPREGQYGDESRALRNARGGIVLCGTADAAGDKTWVLCDEADARLVAAAPELLEALRGAIAEISEHNASAGHVTSADKLGAWSELVKRVEGG